jgi:hypothetical protein
MWFKWCHYTPIHLDRYGVQWVDPSKGMRQGCNQDCSSWTLQFPSFLPMSVTYRAASLGIVLKCFGIGPDPILFNTAGTSDDHTHLGRKGIFYFILILSNFNFMDGREEPHMCMYGVATDRFVMCQTCKVQVMMKYRSENRNPCGVIRRAGGHKSLWIRSRCSHGAPWAGWVLTSTLWVADIHRARQVALKRLISEISSRFTRLPESVRDTFQGTCTCISLAFQREISVRSWKPEEEVTIGGRKWTSLGAPPRSSNGESCWTHDAELLLCSWPWWDWKV